MNESSNRRQFLTKSATISLGIGLFPLSATKTALAYPRPTENAISLAIWSLVRSFRAGVWKLTDMARIVREDFGLDGIEYVNQFFETPTANYLDQLNRNASEHNVKNVLIMVDHEGAMVAKDKQERKQAVINHRKWVEIADYLGCHAIRCNAHGGGETPEEDPDALDRAAESFHDLLDYAKEFKMNVIIENHGGLSSHPRWLPALAEKIDSPHFGLLPDYGNYRPTEKTDIYEALRLAMPYAKGVSVKAGWRPDGTHISHDLDRMLRISKDAGYTGFWGIESGFRAPQGQGARTAEEAKRNDWQAVMWTKAEIEKVIFGKS